MRHASAVVAVVATIHAAAAAQTTLTVGAGGFATIDAALAAAAPGDVIVVQPGSYPPFQANVGVTIRGATPGSVHVGASSATCPPGQVLHLVDLVFPALFLGGGTCTLDRCTVGSGSTAAGLNAANTRLRLQQCTLGGATQPYVPFGNFPALGASSCVVTAVDSTFRGLDGSSAFSGPGYPAVLLLDSSLHGSGLTLTGGNAAGTGSAQPGPALRATGTATFWICDSTLRGGAATSVSSMPAACPVEASAGRLARCTLQPSCPAPVPTAGALLGVHRPAPLASGASFTLAFRTEPNGFVGVFATTRLGGATIPELEQPVALDLATVMPLAVLAADANGDASGTWTLPPGTANLALWLQAVTPPPLPLQVSPVAGGVVR